MKMSGGLWRQGLVLMSLLFLTGGAGIAGDASECGSKDRDITTQDPQIPLDELEIRLKPLTRCELAEEARDWMALLKTKALEISNVELVAKHKKTEVKQVEQALDALEEAQEALEEASEPDDGSAETDESGKEEADAAIEEAQKQIQEAMDEQERSADAVKTEVTEEVLTETETETEAETDADDVSGEQLLKDEKAAVKQLDQMDAEDLQDQDKLKQATDAAVQLADSKTEIRKTLLEHIAELHAEGTALIDRTNLVIDAFEEKGGDEGLIEEYRQYIKAVSGLKIDVTDVDATSTAIMGWLVSKEGGLRWGKNLGIFIVTVLAFYLLSIILGRAADKALKASRHASALLSEFLAMAIRRGIIAIGLIVGLAALEVNIGPLLAIIGALGFVVAFALQNSLGNFASGILILLYRPFDVGDLIEVSGILGKVSSMNLLSTHIKTPDNKSVIVPNNSIWGDVITNATGTNKRRVDMMFGIGYEDDIDKAQQIMEEILSSHELVLKDPEPVVRLHELADSSLNFVCRPWTRTEHYWDVYWDVTKAVKERFDAEEISIPFPQRDVHLFAEQPLLIDK
jgi:small conductance mechanosensitive channel